jgi:hypothetical protein
MLATARAGALAMAMDDLVRSVALRAGISPAQAARAVSTTLAFLAARLPSPVMGHIHEAVMETGARAGGSPEGERS